MTPELESLNENEIDALVKAPVYVAILIAGADGNIDKAERKEAIDVARGKESRSREQLAGYYNMVSKDFEETFNRLIDELPSGTDERTDEISGELSKLNAIFPKIDRNFSIKIYESLKELATKIAEASGGIFGYLSVGYEEARLLDLKMIDDPSK